MAAFEVIQDKAFAMFGVFAWIILGIFALMIIIFVFNIFKKRKTFSYEVRIKVNEPKGSNELSEVDNDLGGIFLDRKTGNRLFVLKKNRVGLTPDNIPYYRGAKGQKIVEVIQLGLKSFRYLGKPESVSSKSVMEYNIQDQDIAFALNEIEKAKMYEKKTTFDKIKDIIPIVMVFFLAIAVIYFFLNKFEVLKGVADALNQAAASLLEIAKAQQPQQTATIVGN